LTRIAVIEKDYCKSTECNKECIRFCPGTRSGVEIIRMDEENKYPIISEKLCLGCGICAKKCPFKAIWIANLPDELEEECTHRYGVNGFKLYRVPIPKKDAVLGLIGSNAIGKSTCLKILAGRLKPNLGKVDDPPDWPEIIRAYRGSEIQSYFEKLSSGDLRVVFKPQNVDAIPKVLRGTVLEVLEHADERGEVKRVVSALELEKVLDRKLSQLSGGELQRVAIAIACLRDAEVFLFDEPSSYLDVSQRLRMVKLLRSLVEEQEDRYVVVVEHDLAVLDYLTDYVCVLYGQPGAYGIVSQPLSSRTGINIYLNGYIPSENVMFRSETIKFRLSPMPTEWKPEDVLVSWPDLEVELNGFSLKVDPGEAHVGEVVGILGPNGIGKTTFIRVLVGEIEVQGYAPRSDLVLSYKPQYLDFLREEACTVKEYLSRVLESDFESSWYKSNVKYTLGMERLYDRYLYELSGGELQRVAIAACVAKTANVYLLDEPSAYLDVEQRFLVSKVIKRAVESRKAVAFVVEHDIVVQDFLSTTIMVFKGTPGVRGHALPPRGLRKGMNDFLKDVGVTFRRDVQTGRPRINKEGSWADRYQKSVGEYYFPAPLEEG